MSEIVSFLLGSSFAAATATGIYFAVKFGVPLAKAKEYINWYKVGRVKQFADKNGIDIDEVIAVDKARFNHKIQRTWTEKIEHGLAKNLEDIEALEEKPKKKK
jgi:hypothetical protein